MSFNACCRDTDFSLLLLFLCLFSTMYWRIKLYLYNKRRYVCLSVSLSWSMFRMAGQTAGPIDTKLDTRTHVHPGSVSVNSVKVNVKVIHVCVRDWQKYETPGKRHLANDARTTSGGRGKRHLANDYETPTRRGAAGAEQRAPTARVGASRTPSGGRVIRASILYNI